MQVRIKISGSDIQFLAHEDQGGIYSPTHGLLRWSDISPALAQKLAAEHPALVAPPIPVSPPNLDPLDGHAKPKKS